MQFKQKFSIWMRIVAGVLCFSTLWLSSYSAWAATTMSSAASQGQTFGMGAIPSNPQGMWSTNSSGTTVTIPTNGSNQVMSMGDLFPGADSNSTNVDYSSLYGSDANMQSAGASAETELSTDPSMTGQAYQTIKQGTANFDHPDLRNDPIWGQTDSTMSDVFSGAFEDCTRTTTTTPTSMNGVIHDYRNCQKIVKPSAGSCTITHNYDSSWVVKTVSESGDLTGGGSVTSCGPGCMYMYIGKVGDNYLTGNCTVYTQDLQVQVDNPDAIQSATLDYVKWDDYIQVYLNSNEIYHGPNDNFPPDTPGACELDTSWKTNPNIDVTQQFKSQGLLNFKVRVSVGGGAKDMRGSRSSMTRPRSFQVTPGLRRIAWIRASLSLRIQLFAPARPHAQICRHMAAMAA